jgi:TonB family protein
MESTTSQSGIFYFGQQLRQIGSFPKEFRRSIARSFDPRLTTIFVVILVLFCGTIGLLSSRKINEAAYSEKEALKIQERYAQLVLNQPKPKVEEVAKVEKKAVQTSSEEKKASAETAKKEEVKVDRDKETFVQREERKESTRQMREQVREQVKQQVMSAGIFAAITATGSGGSSGGPKASDLLNATGSDLSDISSMNISKGTFATKNVDATTLTAKKGERVSNVGIEKQEVGRASVKQVASAGSVNITSQAPEITGESSNIEERSQAAIGRIVTRETQRLKRVYEDWLKRDPQLAGTLKIKFTILASGQVSNVTVVQSSTNNSDFDEAIIRYIKRWQFPEVAGASSVEVVYPFAFEGQS